MLPKSKLYVLVREDLLPGHQLAQSCHATFRFAAEHPKLTKEWMDVSEYICCLEVENEQELEHYAWMADFLGLPNSRFHEPDLGDEMTAVAFAPYEATSHIMADLGLALRGSYEPASVALGGR